MATFVGSSAGGLGWVLTERVRDGAFTTLGAASGVVAGLVAITPACAYVDPMGAIAIGLLAGVVCSQAVSLKRRFGYDDSLDVVGVHFVGGLVGSLMIGLLSNPGATGWEEGRGPGLAQPGLLFGGGLGLLGEQVLANAVTIVFSGVMTAGILYALSVTIGLRVDDETEVEGLDRAQHAETAYHQAGLAVGTRS
jgi:Amt family ammonium transporter